MNIEFSFENYSDEHKPIAFYSTNFPEIRLNIGDMIWLMDFKKFLTKGNLYCPCEEDWAELEDISGLAEVTFFHHGYDDKIGCILIVSVRCR